MNIKPVTSPHQIPTNGTPEHVRSAKAIAAFNKGASSYDTVPAAAPQVQAPQQPRNHPAQLNQNAISPEDLGSIRQQTSQNEQNDMGVEIEEVQEVEVKQPETPKVDPRIAQLIRQEKAARAKAMQQQEQLKAKEAEIASIKAQIEANNAQYSQGYIKADRLKSDPFGVLSEAGLSYDDLTQRMLNPVSTDPRIESMLTKQQEQIAALQAKLEEAATQKTQQESAAYTEAVKVIRRDVAAMVASDPTFEAIKATSSINDVVELIERTYHEDGVVLSNREAAQAIEDHLVEQLTKYSKINKIKNRIEANQSARSTQGQPAQQQTGNVQKQQQPMKTLTNATASSRQLSAKERAVLAFKGELKS